MYMLIHALTPHIFLDTEAVYSKGRKEIVIHDVNFGGNSNPVRPNPNYNQINEFTNDGRSEYKALVPALQERLFDLEKACWDLGAPSVIVFEGWDSSGKGTSIATLTERMDPRGFKLHPITAPRTYEQQRPWLWRFWLKAPNRGEMVIFDHSWYGRVLEERVDEIVPDKVWRQAYRDINEFERMLAEEGVFMVKVFLHISKEEQRARLQERIDDPEKNWKFHHSDLEVRERWDEYQRCYETAIGSGYLWHEFGDVHLLLP